ncbi:MAG: Nif3-like dinuclear metal center hexameric protein [Negativicutes bacterium]
MAASCGIIAAAIEKVAPVDLAESWDNVGLLVGHPGQKVTKALLVLDVTPDAIEEAIGSQAELVISHHPFPFHAMKSIRADTASGALLTQLLQQKISVYASHTNLDVAVGGVNDALASIFQLEEVSPLRPSCSPLVKIVTYVPEEYVETVWQAMSGAGAGHIGKYSQCSFRVSGRGTFLPDDDTNPFVGEQGRLSVVDETRLEMIAPAFLSDAIVRAMVTAHPYEETAFDVYPLKNSWQMGGLGRVGNLQHSVSLAEFTAQVRDRLSVSGIRFVGPADTMVRRVAVCGGSGMELVEDAKRSGAQVLVTGDIRYHEAKDALANGLCLIDAGHYGTELPVLVILQRYLSECSTKGGWGCLFEVARQQADIWNWRF